MHRNPMLCTNTSQRRIYMKYKSIKYEDVIQHMLNAQNQLNIIFEE